MILASYAIGAQKAFIYCRGEFFEGLNKLQKAVEEAKDKGYLEFDIFGNHRPSRRRSLHRRRRDSIVEFLGRYRATPRLKPLFRLSPAYTANRPSSIT